VQTALVMERLEPVLIDERADLVIVPGDVNSTLAAALVAAKLEIPLAHVESGLRSYDRSMPEEINRVVTDQLSTLLFLHSEEAIANLLREGVEESRLHFVGNTMIDALRAVEDRFRERDAASDFGLARGEYLLVTLHRPALVDGPLLADVLAELQSISPDLPVVFPAHPRTQRMAAEQGLRPGDGIRMIDAVGYLDFLSLEVDARGVLTDSGGVQEEATFLDVPCFTLRDNTERPVTISLGTNTLLGLAPERIAEIPALLEAAGEASSGPPPLWDGRAAERIAGVVAKWRESGDGTAPGSHVPGRRLAGTWRP
jgi:UDP-N-acetylglucosamine 2-epimerase (non-hydrolysing)